MFDKLIKKLNKIMNKVCEMKKVKDEKIKELEEVVANQENDKMELIAHIELVNEDMLTLIGEMEVLKNKAVDEDGLVELERVIEALEEMVDDESN